VKFQVTKQQYSPARMPMLFLLVISLTGCSSFFSMETMKTDVRKFLKSDLHAFLDGDSIGIPKEEEPEPVVEEEPVVVEEVVKHAKEGKESEKQEDTGKDGGEGMVVAEVPKKPVIVERCSPDTDPKFSYRRRIALLAFDINNRQESSDFPHIETQYPELLHDFIDSDRFIVRTATEYRLLNKTDLQRGAWVESNRLQIMKLAKDLQVQFIVTGVAEDMSVVDPRIDTFQLLMNRAARNRLRGEVIRHLEMSLNVYDGTTGRLIKRQTFADAVAIDALSLNKRKLLNKTFLKSNYGQLMAKILQKQSDFLLPALDCIPMQMTVLSVDNGSITFDAGIESLVLPGDRLQLYRRIRMDWEGTVDKLYRLQRYGSLTVSRSSTFSAEAEFEQASMASGVNPGDIVQAW